MKEFPTELELQVASSLLLLSSTLFSSSSSKIELEEDPVKYEKEIGEKSIGEFVTCIEKENSVDSTPCDSSLTTDDRVKVDRYFKFELKIAKRARSKVIYKNMIGRKPSTILNKNPPLMKPKQVTSSQQTASTTITTEGSCLSSAGTSEITSGVSKRQSKKEAKRRKEVDPPHIRRRAEAILRFLTTGCAASEVRIRQLLGDSPDTSKALRMLLRMNEVKRSGIGGRTDPFIYSVAATKAKTPTI